MRRATRPWGDAHRWVRTGARFRAECRSASGVLSRRRSYRPFLSDRRRRSAGRPVETSFEKRGIARDVVGDPDVHRRRGLDEVMVEIDREVHAGQEAAVGAGVASGGPAPASAALASDASEPASRSPELPALAHAAQIESTAAPEAKRIGPGYPRSRLLASRVSSEEGRGGGPQERFALERHWQAWVRDYGLSVEGS
jgi:hypothetical protein